LRSSDASHDLVEELVAREAVRMLQFFVRRVHNPEDAADLVSETLLIAWRRHASIPTDKDESRMWLYGVGRRVLSTHWRTRRRRGALNDRLRDNLAATSQWAHEGPDVDGIRDAITKLKPVDRELITLVYWDGFTLAEAATLLKVKPATARSRIARARATLKNRLTGSPESTLAVAPA